MIVDSKKIKDIVVDSSKINYIVVDSSKIKDIVVDSSKIIQNYDFKLTQSTSYFIQWAPIKSGIGRRLLDSSYDFEESNEHETQYMYSVNQIDSSTIDGNVKFISSQYSCILTYQVLIQFLCPTKV